MNKISLADQLNEENDNLLYGDTSNKRSTVNTIITEDQHNTNPKNKSKGTKSNNKPTASDIANEQITEIENELHQARINAVKSRWKNGAYRGAIDATNFTLANPGMFAFVLFHYVNSTVQYEVCVIWPLHFT